MLQLEPSSPRQEVSVDVISWSKEGSDNITELMWDVVTLIPATSSFLRHNKRMCILAQSGTLLLLDSVHRRNQRSNRAFGRFLCLKAAALLRSVHPSAGQLARPVWVTDIRSDGCDLGGRATALNGSRTRRTDAQ